MHDLLQKIRDKRPNAFDHFITLVIVGAGILIGLETDATLQARHGALFQRLDRIILAIFVIEIALKMALAGRRPWRYFVDHDADAAQPGQPPGPRSAVSVWPWTWRWHRLDAWHCFDFAIVALCLLPHLLPIHIHAQFLPLVRVARILRLLRLAEELPKLHVLVNALLKSLPSISYICVFLLLHFYSYAVAGTFLFSGQDREHFGSVGVAMLTLFEVVTGNGFSTLMREAMARAALGGYATWTPIVFYTTFVIIGVTIILNLFVGVIISEMSLMQKEADERARAQCQADAAAGQHGDVGREVAALEAQLEAMQAAVARLKRIPK